MVAKLCTKQACLLAFDPFGHGLSGYAPEISSNRRQWIQSRATSGEVKNFSITRFVDDVIKILQNILVRKEHVGGGKCVSTLIVLIGHIWAELAPPMHAARVRLDDMVEVVGLVVVDVVEGTARLSTYGRLLRKYQRISRL